LEPSGAPRSSGLVLLPDLPHPRFDNLGAVAGADDQHVAEIDGLEHIGETPEPAVERIRVFDDTKLQSTISFPPLVK
jgi:hypothetical protein